MARQLLVIQGFLTVEASPSHSDTQQSAGLLPLPDNTQVTKYTPGGIRNRISSKRAAADPPFRPRFHWDRLVL